MKSTTQLVSLYLLAIPPGSFPTGGKPSGHLYVEMMAEGITLEMHTKLLFAFSDPLTCKGEKIVEVVNHYVTLTPKGEQLRKDIIEILVDSQDTPPV